MRQRHSYYWFPFAIWVEAIASRVEAIPIQLEAIAIRVEAIASRGAGLKKSRFPNGQPWLNVAWIGHVPFARKKMLCMCCSFSASIPLDFWTIFCFLPSFLPSFLLSLLACLLACLTFFLSFVPSSFLSVPSHPCVPSSGCSLGSAAGGQGADTSSSSSSLLSGP